MLEETPVVVSRRGREAGAYGHYFGDTVARAHHEDRIVLYQDTLERDFGHDPDLLRSRWSAPCATRSPTTWAGTSAVSAAWDCRPTLPARPPEGYPSGFGRGVRVA